MHVLKEMTMSSVARVADRSDFATLTDSFLDVTAAIETKLHDSELRIQKLQRELRHAQQQQHRAQQWIVLLRRSHRTESHRKTAQIFKHALSELAALDVMPGCRPVMTPATLFHLEKVS
jgi:hypothetical protein